MTIFSEGKEIVAKRHNYKDWDKLMDDNFLVNRERWKEYIIEAAQESRRILYEAYKERFPDSDEEFEFLENYIFVNLVKP